MMWKPSVNAIWLRAASRFDASISGARSAVDPLHGQAPLGAAAAEEAERPADQRPEPVLEAGHEHDVHGQPHQPAEEAGDADAVEADDRTAARDGGHAAQVAVAEVLRLLAVEA